MDNIAKEGDEIGMGIAAPVDPAERSVGGPSNLGHQPIRVAKEALQAFTTAFFVKMGLNTEEAQGAAEILVTSDLRNIESHGVARLDMYRRMFVQKVAQPQAVFEIKRETGATALVDGGGGLGLVVARRAMELAIQKAKATGLGFVTVTNSSHFGIAGFYPDMALAHDMIGLAMTNATPQLVPTNGRAAALGTNPIAFAAPAKEEFPFLLDMATTAVAFGKIEIAARLEKAIPLGWGLDGQGQPTTDPLVTFEALALNPLGSTAEMSSHKGYGLAAMVDILCGVLSGMGHSLKVPRSRAGHFFGAIQIEAFRDLEEFKLEMDEMIRDLKAIPPLQEGGRVYVAGEKEYLAQAENLRLGIPLHPKIIYRMAQLSQELDIPPLAN